MEQKINGIFAADSFGIHFTATKHLKTYILELKKIVALSR